MFWNKKKVDNNPLLQVVGCNVFWSSVTICVLYIPFMVTVQESMQFKYSVPSTPEPDGVSPEHALRGFNSLQGTWQGYEVHTNR